MVFFTDLYKIVFSFSVRVASDKQTAEGDTNQREQTVEQILPLRRDRDRMPADDRRWHCNADAWWAGIWVSRSSVLALVLPEKLWKEPFYIDRPSLEKNSLFYLFRLPTNESQEVESVVLRSKYTECVCSTPRWVWEREENVWGLNLLTFFSSCFFLSSQHIFCEPWFETLPKSLGGWFWWGDDWLDV